MTPCGVDILCIIYTIIYGLQFNLLLYIIYIIVSLNFFATLSYCCPFMKEQVFSWPWLRNVTHPSLENQENILLKMQADESML